MATFTLVNSTDDLTQPSKNKNPKLLLFSDIRIYCTRLEEEAVQAGKIMPLSKISTLQDSIPTDDFTGDYSHTQLATGLNDVLNWRQSAQHLARASP